MFITSLGAFNVNGKFVSVCPLLKHQKVIYAEVIQYRRSNGLFDPNELGHREMFLSFRPAKSKCTWLN